MIDVALALACPNSLQNAVSNETGHGKRSRLMMWDEGSGVVGISEFLSALIILTKTDPPTISNRTPSREVS